MTVTLTSNVQNLPGSKNGKERSENSAIDVSVITACKRSLGQGNLFTGVSYSVPSGVCIQGIYIPGGLHLGGLHSGGWLQTPSPIHGILRDTVNERTVHILLECILV